MQEDRETSGDKGEVEKDLMDRKHVMWRTLTERSETKNRTTKSTRKGDVVLRK